MLFLPMRQVIFHVVVCEHHHPHNVQLRSTEKNPNARKKSDIFELKLNLRIKLSIQSLPVSTLVYFLKHKSTWLQKSRGK